MKDNFDLNLEIDLAAEEICSGIVSERKRKRVIEEIKAHFEDSVYQKTLDGNCPEDAFGITYKEFCNGDSREIRRLLARTHNVFSSEAQKKIVYYLSPLVIFPAFFLLLLFLDGTALQDHVLIGLSYTVFFVCSAIIGNLSPTDKKFDYLMTAIIPLVIACSLFIGLYFDEGCDGTPQLSLHHALNVEYYKCWLPVFIITAVTTFLASFRPIRIVKRLNEKAVR